MPLGNGDHAEGAPTGRPRGSGRIGGASGDGEGSGGDDALDVDAGPDEDPDVDAGVDDSDDAQDGARDDAPPEADGTPVEPQELRPPRKFRLWQIAPIVVLSALGSLMFAFPLAFEPGGGTGAVVSMLGLLICGCAAGWVVVAARRVGLSWPGLPAPDSGRRADWRIVALYAVIVGTVVVLAIWRVARLR
ncbi:hypothetical protein [Streptomyces marispadix]|uniref:Transmembrane protein n=1 Tax=Streptomyces marispadix TaxID=2922868 RepID=A0ABS9T3C7_9ACTN|nr:hypothetical protein [Streptomyces marispadix]MCH6163012.1 hypothetical protein [Streptomyces marispadix]